MKGKVFAEQPLMFTRRIGDASGTDVKLEIMTSVPLGEPVIRHQDGRAFTLCWDDIVAMADEAFKLDACKTKVAP